MPLAGLCASRGRGDCPDLFHGPANDRCFSLVQADYLTDDGDKKDDGGGGGDRNQEGDDTDGGEGQSPASPAGAGRTRKWGIGGTLPASLVHGRRWRWGSGPGEPTERLSASSSPSRSSARAAGGAAAAAHRRAAAGARERMGLETASAEECTALVDEINELVRRAGLKDGGGGSSARGRDLFDDWVRSSKAGRDADAAANAANAEVGEGGGPKGARTGLSERRDGASKALLGGGGG